jgi:Tol biopolymer transport system component
VYFTSNRTGRGQLDVWRIPAGGGEAQPVTIDGGSEALESVDGKLLYFRRTTDGSPFLYVRPVDGGREQRIDSLVYWNYWPTERGVIYVARPDEVRPPYTYRVKLWESATGTSRVVSSFQAVAVGPSLTATRDGKTILLSGVTTLNLDLMLIENLR